MAGELVVCLRFIRYLFSSTVGPTERSWSHWGVGSKYPVPGMRCWRTTSSLRVTPRPGRSGTVIQPCSTMGVFTPSSTIDDHQGTSSEWFSSARKLSVAAAQCTLAMQLTGVPAKCIAIGTPYSSAMSPIL